MRILLIDSNTTGPFGLVSGDIAGIVVAYADGKMFDFTWDGRDERNPVCDCSWVRMKEKDPLEWLNGALSAYSASSAKYYTHSPLLFLCSIISLYLCNFTTTFLTDNLAPDF